MFIHFQRKYFVIYNSGISNSSLDKLSYGRYSSDCQVAPYSKILAMCV